MAWEWELLNLAGVPVGLVVPRSVVITRPLNGATRIGLVLDADGAPYLSTTARIVRGWRRPDAGGDRVLRAAGRVISIQASASADSVPSLNVTAVDGFGVIQRRLTGAKDVFEATLPRDILDEVIVEAGRDVTGLVLADGLGPSGPPRDRTYDVGKNVGEIITQLAEVDDGFYFRVDAQYDEQYPRRFSRLVMLYPESGVDRPGARWEFGPGTIGNLSSIQIDIGLPTNVVYAFGAGDGDDQLRGYRADGASIATHGPFEVSISHPDVVNIETLEQHAQEALRPSEPIVLRVAPAVPTGSVVHTPTPWEDFEVGDIVRVTTRGSGLLDGDYSARVTSFTVQIDAEGVERLSGLDLEVA